MKDKLPVNQHPWRDIEIKVLLDSMLREVGGGRRGKHLEPSAFIIVRGDLMTACSSSIPFHEITEKYMSMGTDYFDYLQNEKIRNINCEFSTRDDVHHRTFSSYPQEGSMEVDFSSRPLLPFFKELNLLFGKPSDWDIINNTTEIVDTPSEPAHERPQEKKTFKSESNRNPWSTLPCAEEKQKGGWQNAKRAAQAEDLHKRNPQESTKIERVVAILMEEYSDVLDMEEMNDCLIILEDEKKADIFLSITKRELRNFWLHKQVLMARGS
ncbi:hypothetical protein DFP73DRAFT_630319 [Morchella snyderi]|nr:hypothetical protein DFP73DRAFT_630319 [Morchella snyderi]